MESYIKDTAGSQLSQPIGALVECEALIKQLGERLSQSCAVLSSTVDELLGSQPTGDANASAKMTAGGRLGDIAISLRNLIDRAALIEQAASRLANSTN